MFEKVPDLPDERRSPASWISAAIGERAGGDASRRCAAMGFAEPDRDRRGGARLAGGPAAGAALASGRAN